MRKLGFILFFIFFSSTLVGQTFQELNGKTRDTISQQTQDSISTTIKVKKQKPKKSLLDRLDPKDSKDKKPKIQDYLIISHKNDTTYVDTTLTIQKDYKFNYLRKDNFGLIPFSNLGQT